MEDTQLIKLHLDRIEELEVLLKLEKGHLTGYLEVINMDTILESLPSPKKILNNRRKKIINTQPKLPNDPNLIYEILIETRSMTTLEIQLDCKGNLLNKTETTEY